jgi:hypothetical protein
MQAGGLSAVHATIACTKTPAKPCHAWSEWNRRFETWPELIRPVRTASDIRLAHGEGRVGIFFGFQNCSPIEDDIALVEVFRQLGVFVMQLTYNNQSLLASGCYEREDNGISRFGRQVIAEMNRVGMLIDMSHSAERSTLAIELSSRPVIISHANPASFHAAKRNKSDAVLRGIAESGGLLGFSTYPFHLKGASDCSLESFCDMVARRRPDGCGAHRHRHRPVPGATLVGAGMDAQRPLEQDKDRRRLQGQRQLAGALAVVPRQPRLATLPRACAPAASPTGREHHGAELAALAGDRQHRPEPARTASTIKKSQVPEVS